MAMEEKHLTYLRKPHPTKEGIYQEKKEKSAKNVMAKKLIKKGSYIFTSN